MKIAIHSTFAVAALALTSCSDNGYQFASEAGALKANRLSGTNNGDFNASADLSNSVTATAADSAALPSSKIKIPVKEGANPESPSEADKLDNGIIGACLEKSNSANSFQNYRVVDINSTNQNNNTLYEDPDSSDPSLILLRISLKNVNNSDLKLLNPKSTYCIDMQVKNMNKFRFEIACESKVGFVRLEKKNANNMSTSVVPVSCE
ncbi:MAG: hypothetical protein RI953_2438 [Pseudomonadota bacterium]|jgi:hypothetical protein